MKRLTDPKWVALARAEAVWIDNSGPFPGSSIKSAVLSQPNWEGGYDGLAFTVQYLSRDKAITVQSSSLGT